MEVSGRQTWQLWLLKGGTLDRLVGKPGGRSKNDVFVTIGHVHFVYYVDALGLSCPADGLDARLSILCLGEGCICCGRVPYFRKLESLVGFCLNSSDKGAQVIREFIRKALSESHESLPFRNCPDDLSRKLKGRVAVATVGVDSLPPAFSGAMALWRAYGTCSRGGQRPGWGSDASTLPASWIAAKNLGLLSCRRATT